MNTSLTDQRILSIAKKTLAEYKLCNPCLGRLFAKISSGITNRRRGETVRKKLHKIEEIKTKNCWLCEGLLDEIPHFANLIIESLKDYEFETFLIGSKVDEDILAREIELLNFSKSNYVESLNAEVKREISKLVTKKLEKRADFDSPDIIAVIDTSYDVVNLQIASLYIYGRYKKLSRGIPQTKWFCHICRGKGCRQCNYTGRVYKKSVEELIAKQILKKTKTTNESFHGGGREDIDVCMLGTGRPFVLEIKNPKVRNLDLTQLENEINEYANGNVEVCNLRFSNKEEIVSVKNTRFRKKYRVSIRGKNFFNKEKLNEAAQLLRGKEIQQFTPSRVAHRRANMVRAKKVYQIIPEVIAGHTAVLIIETESGTYIKELISGDNGRTHPNISDIIGMPIEVEQLDVLEVKGEIR